MSRFSTRLHDMPARMGLRVTNFPPVRHWLARRYRSAVDRHRPRLASLTGISAAIVTALQDHGIAVVDLADLPIAGALATLNAAQGLARSYAGEARRRSAAGEDLIYVPPETLMQRPDIYRMGLDSVMLDIAEGYLGVPIGYDGVTLFYTVADKREVSTRCWHRDWEDRRTLKVGVYCSDVGPGDGPFEFVTRRDTAEGDSGGFHYHAATSRDLAARLGGDYTRSVKSCQGPAGTVIFVETAQHYHRGAPALTGDRLALFYSYFAHRPLHPFFCERSGFSRDQIRTLAADMPPRQRAAALWQAALPPVLKVIPPARL